MSRVGDPEVATAAGEQVDRRSADTTTWLIVYTFVLLAIPSRIVVGPLGSAGAPSMLMGLLSLVLWACFLLLRPGSGKHRFYPLRWALGGLLLVSGISYAVAMARPLNADEISPADVSLLSLLSWAGTMLLAADTITNRRRVADLVWWIAMAGGLLAVLGLAQFFTAQSFTDFIAIPGLTDVSTSGVQIRNGVVRPNGTATHPIEYGTIIAMILPVALHVALFDKTRSLLLRWIPVLAIAAVTGLSGSRSAYLCAAIGVLICAIAWPPVLRRWVVAVSITGLVLVALVWPRIMRIIIGLFSDLENDPSIESRTGSFDLAWAFVAQDPLFGRGPGTFLPKYRIFDNQFLVQLVSVGIIGTIALITLGAVAIYEMRRVAVSARRAKDLPMRNLAVALCGSVVAGFCGMAFFDAFSFPMTMGTLFLLLGIIGAISRAHRDAYPLGAIGSGPDAFEPAWSTPGTPVARTEQDAKSRQAGSFAKHGGSACFPNEDSEPKQSG